jgi:hypothetical protein
MERECAVVLTDNGGRRRCSGGNERGGVSSGRSRRGGRVGGGEGGELELGCGRRTKQSEASVASPNQRAREGEPERERGVGSVPCGGRKTGEREGPEHGDRQRGLRGQDGSGWCGRRRQRALMAEAG